MQEEASVRAEGKVTMLLTCPLTLEESGPTFIRGNTAYKGVKSEMKTLVIFCGRQSAGNGGQRCLP